MTPRAWLLAASILLAQALPTHYPGEPLDFEPKLMLDGPKAGTMMDAAPAEPLDHRIARLQAILTHAQARAARSDALFKEGILARVEVEERALRVVKARTDLASAQLDAAAIRVAAVEKSFAARQASQADLAAANAAFKAAQLAASSAAAAWQQGQLNAANIDLQRKRKLYAEGVTSKREVEVAEDHVALLTGSDPQ